ncbi:MAG TPA: DUF4276 family protein [Armatimonadota bacterium]|jgi:hypothetical protein
MRFVLFAEGHTERAVPELLSRWLNPRLSRPVGIQLVRLQGSAEFRKGIRDRVRHHLESPAAAEVLACIGLLDLYGASLPQDPGGGAPEWVQRGTVELEALVDSDRFRMFYAVHEVEAWLLSQPSVFPREVVARLQRYSKAPELVDGTHPPAKVLSNAYLGALKRDYRKVTDGTNLLRRLDPEVVHRACPNFGLMLNTMLAIAKSNGL